MDNRLFTEQTANKNAAMAQIKQINCEAPVCVCGAAFLSSKPMTLELLQFFLFEHFTLYSSSIFDEWNVEWKNCIQEYQYQLLV